MEINLKSDIPIFPEFDPVHFSHKQSFEQITSRFELYSDFNFNSFYSWNTDNKHLVSTLNGNLVLQLGDYITGEPFYTFIGDSSIEKTVTSLISFAHARKFPAQLKLVPEFVIEELKNNKKFIVTEDQENHDYLFSIEELSELSGNRYKSKRRAAQKCKTENDIIIKKSLSAAEVAVQVIEFLNNWEDTKNELGKEVDLGYERVAIKRILETLDSQSSLLLTGAFLNETLVGFSIDELLPQGFVLSHYFKATPAIYGLSEYLNQEVAQHLLSAGGKTWNWEQDLGIENLRTMKLSHRPIGRQKKITLSIK